MPIHVALTHRTTYEYDREIVVHPQTIRLRPAPHCRTPILSYSLKVTPEEQFLNWQQDPFGNYLARVVFPEKTDRFEVIVDLVAEMTAINPFDFFLEEAAEEFPFSYGERLETDLAPYLRVTDDSEDLERLAAQFRGPKQRTIDFLVAVNNRVNELVSYNIRMEPGVQNCEETLRLRSGSCRDSAFLLMELLRKIGIASRFVSGYLIQLVEDEKPIEGPEGPSADFTDLHAWTEAYIPGAGWIGLDPTSGLFASEGHIPLACTPEPTSAAAISGAVDPCECEFSFENAVRRVHEDARVTKPYSKRVWKSIDALGEAVDKRLAANDVRLTMGGEPTFVSVDDMDGPEWNTTADSPVKRQLGLDLTRRLRDAFGPGGIIWTGEGKWYPGEPVPRWAYGVFWRTDGVSMPGSGKREANPAVSGKHGYREPGLLLAETARLLGVPGDCILPAYEDAYYYQWKATALPFYENPWDASEDASLERRTLADLHKRGLDVPTGSVLPLFVDPETGLWTASKWKLKREKLYLIPGASPIGLRMPLDSIREATEEDVIEERSPMEEERAPLPNDLLHAYRGRRPGPRSYGKWIPRTALAIENREGRLHVFFPPTAMLEDYMVLLAAVSEAAERLGYDFVVQGYEPPADPRLQSLKVTPDPGVIEVNIHPSSNWRELVERTKRLYAEARQTRLGTEKFMLDGRHTGTGGGNHVVVGGTNAWESPFLRRHDLLASLVCFWQHHPGLSYLFSGTFIGPTSQAPRVDEGRDDRMFELEIALEALHRGVEEPVMVDRIMRHLLTDLTGNTHRAEICIDKLYPSDSYSRQLGLVELRGFEMPPHREMALVQSLLVRALICHFWEKPYRKRPIRWGTTLHDKFLLPYFVWQDIDEVCGELRENGIPFATEWFEPFYEFRFPKYGDIERAGMELEIRGALEPWHVLGEEASSSGTARFVDSSIERLQLMIRGATEGRHVLTCNGRRVPLFQTGTKGESVGGVRFKAWNPPSSLHPMIPAQSQLVFDLVDTWNQRSLGGCVYHVSHPGGRSYDTFPVNAREAESRRIARFWDHGHTAGVIEPMAAPPTEGPRVVETQGGGHLATAVPLETKFGEFPHTLDLRTPSGLQARQNE